MSTPTQPAPGKKLNRIGLEPIAYRGSKTTLCAGCGHNAITERIIDSFFELGIEPDSGAQAVGHRLLEQEPGVLPEPVARLQLRSRAHAVSRPPARSWPTAR